ncbi:hypothetical protein J0X19_22150 [Hymenobacter sp. BT186]|uniref:Uncharacterized protein n=1 Tax=Hymenobacter telluris TaxID=2816474 RepID=A0A939F0N3_9BACT|nr:hypothetical protein [Hymenobacter telluris]MBO0360679.1 hypothetical protein [Hymenobacter telluris]MBW3376706.1 hypothetical protein [Hymenobacter norwichensis]
MKKILFNSAGNVAYLNGSVFSLGGAMAAAGASGGSAATKDGAAPSSPVLKGETGDVALWGPNNDFPQQVIAQAEKSTIIPSVLDWKTRAVYGGGPVYGRVTGYDQDGNEQFQRERLPDVEAFFRRSNIKRYAFEGLQNLFWFAQSYPELIQSLNKSKITTLTTQDTAFCRYSVPRASQPVPDWCHISANWPDAKPGDEYTTSVPVLDPYYDPVEALRADTRGFKHIYPLALPSPGKSLYQLASWNSIRRSGWLEVAQAIPEFKAALFKNQISVKYLIETHEGYWKWKYPDWDTKLTEVRRQLIADELAAFEATMTGTQGAGKSIMSLTITDPRTGEQIKAFNVTAIDDKLKSGLHIEDSQEASSHIYTALSVDPTLVGISPGKGMGAGSGSDKRVAFNNFISTHRFHQDLILEPLYLVRDYNGWPADLEFRFLNPLSQTADLSNANKNTAAGGQNDAADPA